MNISLMKLGTQDIDKFIELIQLFEAVFEMEDFTLPDKEHLQAVLDKKDFVAFVAMDENGVIGGLTAYTVEQYYSHKPLAFIYDIAIKTIYQRNGIGKNLITALTDYCKNNGIEQMFVLADSEDEHAVEFYRSTKATESKVINFDYYLK